jgi:hypothetical protein
MVTTKGSKMEQLVVIARDTWDKSKQLGAWYFGPFTNELIAERFCSEMCIKWCTRDWAQWELTIAVLHTGGKVPGKLVGDEWHSLCGLNDDTRENWRKIRKERNAK